MPDTVLSKPRNEVPLPLLSRLRNEVPLLLLSRPRNEVALTLLVRPKCLVEVEKLDMAVDAVEGKVGSEGRKVVDGCVPSVADALGECAWLTVNRDVEYPNLLPVAIGPGALSPVILTFPLCRPGGSSPVNALRRT